MTTEAFCRRALAYLKPSLSAEEAPAALKLDEDDMPVLKDLHNGLLVSYVVDEGDSFTYVQNYHLAEAGLTADELHTVAVRNLAAKSTGVLRAAPYDSIVAVFFDGNFEASLILLDELWDGPFAQFVGSGFVAALPARDILAFCDLDSDAGRAALRGVVDRVTPTGDHLLSERLYSRIDGAWTPLADA